MSFIPRAQPTAGRDSLPAALTATMPADTTKARLTPSKIPSPTPQLTGQRATSPRQYTQLQTAQQSKHIAAGISFAEPQPATKSPSKTSARSYTTPNLKNGMSPTGHPGFMKLRKPMVQQEPARSLGVQRSPMKENTPTGKRDSRRLSHLIEKSPRSGGITASSPLSNRRSTGLSVSLAQSKQPLGTTLSSTGKRLSTNVSTQTSTTAKRIQPNRQASLQPNRNSRISNSHFVAQSRLMGPVDPATPTRSGSTSSRRGGVPHASTERDLRRVTLQAPGGHGGTGTRSRAQNGTSHEVRMPRSSTFHIIPRLWETPPPPVPPIPENYRTPPKAPSTQNSRQGVYANTLDNRFAFASHSTSMLPPPQTRSHIDIGNTVSSPLDLDPDSGSGEKASTTVWPFADESSRIMIPAAPARSWSISAQDLQDVADTGPEKQITDYMPPIWWAARFQTRLDQWRTEAMHAELNPKCKPEGLLGGCSLSQEKIAACHILLQLRDLCCSKQAADSLWEYEYKYRLENKLLDMMMDCQFSRKPDGYPTPKQGPFGRAVRKLTPRKSSLVNLLKGKGWNRIEDSKGAYGPAEYEMLFGTGQGSSSSWS